MLNNHRAFLLLVASALLVACGGGAGAGGDESVARSAGGEAIRTAGGSAVTEEAHSFWQTAITTFEGIEGGEQGWIAATCESAQAGFSRANDAQGGNFTEALYMMGVVRGRCGDDDGALEFYQRALQSNGEYCGALVGVGLGDMREGRFTQARQKFERAIASDNRCTSAYVNLAIIQREQDDNAREALNNLRRALAIESDYLPAFNQMALLYLGQSAENRQILDLAEVVCRQAQLIDGDYAPIYNTWGLINVRQGQIIQALAKFQRAFTLDTDFYEAYMNFGQLTLSYRGYQDAQNAFTRALELREGDYEATMGLGAALRGLNQLRDAEQKYLAAIEIDQGRPQAYYNLALLYQDYLGTITGPDEQVPRLNQADAYYQQFLQRATSEEALAETVENVTRRCRRRRQTRRRRNNRRNQSEWVGTCTPGRRQQIEEAIRIMSELAQMQAEAEQMQREMEAQQAAQEAQQAQEAAQAEPAAEAPAETSAGEGEGSSESAAPAEGADAGEAQPEAAAESDAEAASGGE